jgi:outer membrane protein OmpA-like peptidoglycan-associated protein
MKKVLLILIMIGTAACTSPEFQEQKKVVIRPVVKEKPQENVLKESPKTKLVLRAEANFAFDKSDIRGEDALKLDKLIEYIKNKPGDITIVGHTDTRGSKEYNKKLSERRAFAVKMYMEERLGIIMHNITAEGRGESENLVEEITQLDRAKNRRVEINFKEENAE